LVTGKGPQSAAISLRALRLDRWFVEVEAGSPAGRVKPAAIRRLLTRWRVAPGEAAYVGDAPSDVAAARASGVTAVAAAWASTADRRRLAAQCPDVLCATVDECRAWLLRRL
jgi:phosphoglycolate phosphatase-like HAD superfamily hydrolase